MFHSKRTKHIVKSLLSNLWQSLITSPIITETHPQCCVVLQGVQSSFLYTYKMSAIIVAHGGAGEISDARAASKVSNLQNT